MTAELDETEGEPQIDDSFTGLQARQRKMFTDAIGVSTRARALSKILGDILGGGSEWFSRVGDDFYIDPQLALVELQRRKTDAHIMRGALARIKRVQGDVISSDIAERALGELSGGRS